MFVCPWRGHLQRSRTAVKVTSWSWPPWSTGNTTTTSLTCTEFSLFLPPLLLSHYTSKKGVPHLSRLGVSFHKRISNHGDCEILSIRDNEMLFTLIKWWKEKSIPLISRFPHFKHVCLATCHGIICGLHWGKNNPKKPDSAGKLSFIRIEEQAWRNRHNTFSLIAYL